jgi:hypothetical protein
LVTAGWVTFNNRAAPFTVPVSMTAWKTSTCLSLNVSASAAVDAEATRCFGNVDDSATFCSCNRLEGPEV